MYWTPEHPTLYFMFLKEYSFRELYLGLKVTASFDQSESYTRIIDGQVRCITPDFKPKDLQVAWNVQFITVFVPRMDDFLQYTTACAGKALKILYKKQIGTHREKKHVLTLTLMLVRRKSACKTSAGSSKIFPMAGPHFWVQIWTPKRGPSKDLKEGMKM